jgi:hypothetical protein
LAGCGFYGEAQAAHFVSAENNDQLIAEGSIAELKIFVVKDATGRDQPEKAFRKSRPSSISSLICS